MSTMESRAGRRAPVFCVGDPFDGPVTTAPVAAVVRLELHVSAETLVAALTCSPGMDEVISRFAATGFADAAEVRREAVAWLVSEGTDGVWARQARLSRDWSVLDGDQLRRWRACAALVWQAFGLPGPAPVAPADARTLLGPVYPLTPDGYELVPEAEIEAAEIGTLVGAR
jgi:hypothetical protein